MSPEDWLLIFLAMPVGDEERVPPKADPIRIQKGLFLLSMEGGIPQAERYNFIPYDYGACSFDIYRDLDSLVRTSMLERIQGPWDPWPTYRPTAAGLERAEEGLRSVDNKKISYLRNTKNRLFRQGFTEMLREIYKAHPQYAVNSLLKIT